MKRKIIILFILIFILLISNNKKDYTIDTNKIIGNKTDIEVSNKEEKVETVSIFYDNMETDINIDDYVIGVVSCEMPASFDDEALKAMSVAARTFAIYKIENNKNYVLKTNTSDQCYIDKNKMKEKWGSNMDKYYNKIKKSVNETSKEIMTYDDKVILSLYFSISNGYTENVENVFNQRLNYLVSVESSWDKNLNYKEDKKTISLESFNKLLNEKNITNKDINIKRSKTGRVLSVKIKEKEYKGTEFRNILKLKSTDFTIDIKDEVLIKTKGYGHGVGMSEYGANEMAKLGYTYKEILKHYYNGINIVNNY